MGHYIRSNITNGSISNLFRSFLNQFYNEIEVHAIKTKRTDKYHIAEYGELGLVNILINGIIRADSKHRFLIINEFELEDKKGIYSGRVDIIIEDTEQSNVYFIEAKKETSEETAPESDKWLEEPTMKAYNEIFKNKLKNILRLTGIT